MANHYVSPEGLLYANEAYYLAEKQCEGRIHKLNPNDPGSLKSLTYYLDQKLMDKAALFKEFYSYSYNPKDVEVTMSMYNATEFADQELRERLAERQQKELVEKKLQLVDQYGDDTYANGTILQFDKKFTKDGLVYTYAALKTNNTWYVTGERGLFGFTKGSWEELVLGLVGGEFPVAAEEVAIASSVTPLLDSNTSYGPQNHQEWKERVEEVPSVRHEDDFLD